MTEPPPLRQTDRTYVFHGRRKLTYFSGCDYFRLASHPAVVQALHQGADRFGLNVAASRLTTGNHPLYIELEKRLAGFFQAESAVLLSSGYTANIAAAQALSGAFSHVLMDERAHTSLVDAAGIFACPVVRFRHRDPKHIADIFKVMGNLARPIILTDGMFAHDGSVAPLKAYLALLPKEGAMLVDDAHAAGVLGKEGRGTAEYLGVSIEKIVQTVTLSKAFGVYGGAVLGPQRLREQIFERSRIFVGNTPMPLPLAQAALTALRLMKTERGLRTRLRDNVRFVKEELNRIQFPVEATPSPIIPVLPSDQNERNCLKRALLARGIYPPWIQYPGGPPLGYFRFALCSEHSREQLDELLRVLRSWSARS